MADLPEPLVPADVDLTGFPSFGLNVERLLASELVALCSPQEGWAALMLWARAWQQKPPGSLPNDEKVLAAFSRAKSWKQVREMALRGFILCSDGRLYHPMLATEAMRCWQSRLKYEEDKAKNAEKLRSWRARQQEKNPSQPGEETTAVTGYETGYETGSVTGYETGKKGIGEGEKNKTIGTSTAISAPKARAIPNPPAQPGDWVAHFRDKHGVTIDPSNVHDRKKAWPIFAAWCQAALTLERIDAAVVTAREQSTESIAFLPGYVDRVLASQSAPKPVTTSASEARAAERDEVYATLGGRKSSHECTPETIDVAARRVD